MNEAEGKYVIETDDLKSIRDEARDAAEVAAVLPLPDLEPIADELPVGSSEDVFGPVFDFLRSKGYDVSTEDATELLQRMEQDAHAQEVGMSNMVADKPRAVAAFREFLLALGFDVDNDPHMRGTPERVFKLYRNELFRGMYEQAPNITTFDANGKQYDQMIYSGALTVRSTCSHHMLPIAGTAHIAIIPGEGKPLPGLSKYARVLHHYASMPQVQERLTEQVANHLETALEPKGVGVFIRAKHFCMCHRGVHEKDSQMITTELRGVFMAESVKNEFLTTINIDMNHN